MRPGDLDDPTPLEPDDALLERVHARSGAFRRRRQTQRLVSAGAGALVVVLAVGIAVGVGNNRAEPNRPAASTTTTTPPRTAASDLEGTWKPVSIAGYDGPLARLATRARLTFAEDGKFTGFDGCNGFTGSYELGSDASLEVADFGQTLIGCDDQLPIRQTLGATARVDLSDDRLTLLAVDGRELAEFVRPAVTARIELPSGTLTAGSTMNGRLIVDNDTGQVIPAQGCGSLFQVALSSADYQPQLLWLTCSQPLDVPTGVSTYPISVSASDSTAQPLEPGRYEATLYQSTHVVADPPAVTVTVVDPHQVTADFSASHLERELRDAGYEVSANGSFPGRPFASTGRSLCVSGTQLQVYEYRNEVARRAVSNGISADGSTIGRGNSRAIVDWIGPPHFYARGRILALVLQDDTRSFGP